MSELNIFIPLTKIDVEQRLVYGTVAEEVLDNAGEMFDYAKSKPYFQKWSANAELTSGGLSKGNVRAMHGKIAAGKLTDLGFDDDARRVECCAKVVDDNEWSKCLEGVYTGFSMGGRYAERWVEKSDNGMDVKRYAGDPAEISLVDKPCIPTATFQMIKADGMVEEHEFVTVMDADELETEIEKAAQARVPSGPKGGQFASSSGASAGAKGAADMHVSRKEKNPSVLRNVASRMDRTASNYAKAGVKGSVIDNLKGGAAHLRVRASNYEAASKVDAGDSLMKIEYVPSNDELAERGMLLAKNAGQPETSWLDFSDAARDELTSEHMAKAAEGDDLEKAGNPFGKDNKDGEGDDADKGKDADAAKEGDEDKGDFDPDAEKGPKEGEEGAVEEDADKDKDKKDDAEKVDVPEDVPELEQGWKAKDGTFFLKKADALTHNDTLNAAPPPTISEQLEALQKSTTAIINGDVEEPALVVEGDEPTEIEKYASFLEGAGVLLKADNGDGDELQKSMYTVERMARVLRDVGSLQIAVSKEQIREGDDSVTPGMIGVAVGQLGDTLIAMAKEEVDELMLQIAANDVKDVAVDYCCPDVYYELAASTLGLEKADVDELGKAAVVKKSASIQKMHDQCTKMGAKCADAPMAKLDGDETAEDRLAKIDGEMGELRKRAEGAEAELEKIAPLVTSLRDDIEKIKAMPQPAAPRTNVVEKADDVKGVVQTREAAADGTIGGLLEKYTPDQIADAAIRLAQKGGVLMTTRGQVPTGQR